MQHPLRLFPLHPTGVDERSQVGLANPPADPVPLDLPQVDPVLLSNPPNDRRIEPRPIDLRRLDRPRATVCPGRFSASRGSTFEPPNESASRLDGQDGADARPSPLSTSTSLEHPGRRRSDLDIDLVRRHITEGLVGRDRVADLLAATRRPSRRRPRPPSAASRPRSDSQYARSSSSASFMSASCGRTACSSGGLNGIGTSGVVSRRTGASRCSKASLGDQRRDLGADPGRTGRLVGDQDLAGLAGAGEDRVAVERNERAQVDHLDAVAADLLGGRAPRARPPSRRRSRVTSLPSRAIRALPIGTTCSPSGTSPLTCR